MSESLPLLLTRRTLISLAAVVAGLFAVSGIVAAVAGNPAKNDVLDAIGSMAWFGWMLGALVLVVLSIASIVVRATRKNRN